MKKSSEKFWWFKNNAYLCIAIGKQPSTNAKIAQLVEHDLAKVGVAGSSPVFRSKNIEIIIDRNFLNAMRK